ncbi:helix-turn-helix domain-containing protein [Paenibacillus rhizovicinus]|uniref:Helix-turn-helix domain-containing protein n=1 Tax=Paenibacillus rhizovicinus TaxID=2704463 RepID=A0A6C0P5B1_9BACL|nr:helix-turn-helix domain-containing protein [Paenibacillus rhizovicinus]QHW29867.1 helix-turn-helix domain-containing protein [Paenibacillus rhizovicinus]QHW30580.1 helix-turn-helix domain-containing protein [Paenibacillus rhizovicinus]QHW31223.1 helix-turn-helix domain-containing protein [Paenibacillus rhizovicinus]QHW32973.1 helix-turn-helix domain-containing protein [Paenibacillus rhizovicinus]QHW34114.1 helix-turn-helix domain-containing protein [Paenibacillus rhizovicinus]
MAIKGQKFHHYPESIKVEAIRLHVEERWSYSRITAHLEIQDKDRVKRWMRKYREKGVSAFEDRRGNPHRDETKQERELKRLYMEVEVLKKWLQILNREGCKANTSSSTS